MSFSIDFADDVSGYQARIKVIGCGGSGGNAVNTMMNYGLEGVEFMVVNTDIQALNANAAPTKLTIGANITKGLGAGADPERGRKAALEDVQRIKEMLVGADMVFITAGMGGGTGTGAAPVIAQIAREEGILTVGVVTKPFLFEGRQRSRRAEQGLMQLAEHVDTLITIPNQKLLMLEDEDLSFIEAFRKADDVLYQAVRGISDLITHSGVVNVDFADVKTVMSNMGRALMGTGLAKGQNRARIAAEMAIQSPLLDDISVEGATGILINVVGGPDMKMKEIQEAASLVQEQAHPEANIIFGAMIDETLGENIKVTVIATGFEVGAETQPHASHQQSRLTSVMPSSLQASPLGASRNTYQAASSFPASLASQQLQAQAQAHTAASSNYPQAPVSSRRAPVSARPEAISALSSSQTARAAGFGNFPAQESDWDVPAFQRRGQ